MAGNSEPRRRPQHEADPGPVEQQARPRAQVDDGAVDRGRGRFTLSRLSGLGLRVGPGHVAYQRTKLEHGDGLCNVKFYGAFPDSTRRLLHGVFAHRVRTAGTRAL